MIVKIMFKNKKFIKLLNYSIKNNNFNEIIKKNIIKIFF